MISRSPLLREAGHFLAVACGYFAVSLLGVAFVVQPEQLSVFWPGGGLAAGYLLVVDRRHWPTALAAIFVGNAAGNLAHGHTLAVSGGFAVANGVEPFACAWLLGLRGRFRLERAAEVGWLFLVPAAVCAGTALLGAGLVTAGLGAPSYWGVWKVWWLADALGVILFAPLLLTWSGAGRFDRAAGWRATESLLLISALATVSWAIFVADLGRTYPLFSATFPILPILLGVTLRSAAWWTAVAVAVTGLIAVWGTICGSGPIGGLTLLVAEEVLLTQGFAAIVCLSSLTLATTIRERREREAEVGELNRVLAERVREAERVAVALRESENRFQAIFHAQFQFIGLMSPDGTLLEANRTALAAAGVPESDVLGKPFWETVWWAHDPSQQDRLRVATAAAARGERARFEASHPTADGGRMWVDFSLTPFLDEAGRVVLLIPEGRDITDRVRAEERLRASEERFRALFEQSSDAHLLFDEHGIIDCNHAAIQMLRCTDKAAVLSLHPAVLSPEFQPDGRRSLEKCVEMDATARHNGHHRFDWTHRRQDGEDFPCEVTLTPVSLAGRAALLVVWHDLTERARAEEALRASAERFRTAMEASLDAVYFLTAERAADGRVADFRFAELNRRGAELIGRPREDILDRRLCELLPVNRTGGFFERYVRVVATGEPLEEEFPLGPADGIAAAWLHHQVIRVGDGVVITSQDITARKAAEAARLESEARFRSAFEDAAVGMALVGLDGRWLRVNRSLCGIVGYGEAELLATDFQTLTHPDDLEADLGLVRQMLAGTRQAYQMEKRYFHRGGAVVWVLLSVSLVRDGTGAPLYFVAQIKNITERKTAEDRIRASLREKEVMLREIHHRVKNNLAVIASLFHLQSGYTTEEPVLRLLREAQHRVRSMALVHEHLYNSEDLAAVSFGDYTRSLAEQLFRSYRLPDSSVALALDIHPVTLAIDQAVPSGLILNELVSNGLKHAFPERRGTLTVSLRAAGDRAVLRVADDGVGVPPDRLEGKPRSLGLRLIRTLARQLHGTVEFRPAGPGTEVRLEFPIRQDVARS